MGGDAVSLPEEEVAIPRAEVISNQMLRGAEAVQRFHAAPDGRPSSDDPPGILISYIRRDQRLGFIKAPFIQQVLEQRDEFIRRRNFVGTKPLSFLEILSHASSLPSSHGSPLRNVRGRRGFIS